MKKEKQAFTLIELLVVIAIIGLLSTLSIIALNTARAKSRDAKRISDVRQMQVALELYYNDTNEYPDGSQAGQKMGPGDKIKGDSVYLASIPKPPQVEDGSDCSGTKNAYTYKKVTDTNADDANSSYTIDFCLGSDVNDVKAGKNHMTPSGIKRGASGN